MIDANTMLMSVNVMVVPANMVANVKMNLEHFIATVHQDMVEHIVNRILTSVLINHVLMEEPASTKWEGSTVIARKLGPKNSEYNDSDEVVKMLQTNID